MFEYKDAIRKRLMLITLIGRGYGIQEQKIQVETNAGDFDLAFGFFMNCCLC